MSGGPNAFRSEQIVSSRITLPPGGRVVLQSVPRRLIAPGTCLVELNRPPSSVNFPVYKIRTVVSILRICTATLRPSPPRPQSAYRLVHQRIKKTPVLDLTLWTWMMSQKPVWHDTTPESAGYFVLVGIWGYQIIRDGGMMGSDAERRESGPPAATGHSHGGIRFQENPQQREIIPSPARAANSQPIKPCCSE